MSFSFVSVYYQRKAIGKRDYLNHIIQLKQSKINTKMKKLSFSLNNRTDRKFFQEKWKDLFSKGTLLIFRTCPHRVNVRIFRHNFVGGKAKIRRRAVALQGFLRQHRTNLVLKMRRQIFSSDCIEIQQAYYRMSRDFCAR